MPGLAGVPIRIANYRRLAEGSGYLVRFVVRQNHITCASAQAVFVTHIADSTVSHNVVDGFAARSGGGGAFNIGLQSWQQCNQVVVRNLTMQSNRATKPLSTIGGHDYAELVKWDL
eukprot:SAG11_NODE_34_length_22265_cov_11.264730_10_plen_116_part_00